MKRNLNIKALKWMVEELRPSQTYSLVTKLNRHFYFTIDVKNVQRFAGWKRTVDTAMVHCWRGTLTTTRSDVSISRTAAAAAMTTATRPRKNASLSACGSQMWVSSEYTLSGESTGHYCDMWSIPLHFTHITNQLIFHILHRQRLLGSWGLSSKILGVLQP